MSISFETKSIERVVIGQWLLDVAFKRFPFIVHTTSYQLLLKSLEIQSSRILYR